MDFHYGMVGYDFKRLSTALNKNYYHNIYILLELYTYFKRNNPKYAKLYQIDKNLTLVMAFGENWVLNRAYMP